MWPDWESNPQIFGVWDDAPTNWATLARAVKGFDLENNVVLMKIIGGIYLWATQRKGVRYEVVEGVGSALGPTGVETFRAFDVPSET